MDPSLSGNELQAALLREAGYNLDDYSVEGNLEHPSSSIESAEGVAAVANLQATIGECGIALSVAYEGVTVDATIPYLLRGATTVRQQKAAIARRLVTRAVLMEPKSVRLLDIFRRVLPEEGSTSHDYLPLFASTKTWWVHKLRINTSQVIMTTNPVGYVRVNPRFVVTSVQDAPINGASG